VFAAIAVGVFLLLATFALISSNHTHPRGVTISVTGWTNGGVTPFVILTLSNQDNVPIRNRGHVSEVEGNGNLLAPIGNPSLPHLTMTQLNAGGKVVFAIGQPNDGERWRVMFMYERKGAKERFDDYAWQHRKAFPFSMFKISQPKMVIQTNYSEWLEMHPLIQKK
jgi:hypothetical protein